MPIELPLKSVRASACRSIGLRRRTTSASPFGGWGGGRVVPSAWKRLSTPIELPLKNVRASACRSIGLGRRTTSASPSCAKTQPF